MSTIKCEICGEIYDSNCADGAWADDGTFIWDDCICFPKTAQDYIDEVSE